MVPGPDDAQNWASLQSLSVSGDQAREVNEGGAAADGAAAGGESARGEGVSMPADDDGLPPVPTEPAFEHSGLLFSLPFVSWLFKRWFYTNVSLIHMDPVGWD